MCFCMTGGFCFASIRGKNIERKSSEVHRMYFKKCGVVHEDPAVFCKQCSYQSNVQPVMQGNVSQSVGMQDTPVKKKRKEKKGPDRLRCFADVHGGYSIFYSMLSECSSGTGGKRRLAYGTKGQFFGRITYGKYRRRASLAPGDLYVRKR